jgi:ATP-dependent Zn protease
LCLQITYDTHLAVDQHMQIMLDEAYANVKAMLDRNRAALDMTIDRLISAPDQQLDGTEVRQILERNGDSSDLQHRRENQAVFA